MMKTCFLRAFALSLLISFGLPLTGRANVIVTSVERSALAQANGQNFVEIQFFDRHDLTFTGSGDFSGSVSAYQEAASVNPFTPGKVAVAEAKIEFTSDATENLFSAQVDLSEFMKTALGGFAVTQVLFTYAVDFTLTEATIVDGSVMTTPYDVVETRFTLRNTTTNEVPQDLSFSTHFISLLQPGDYHFSYFVNGTNGFSDVQHTSNLMAHALFEFSFRSDPSPPATTVPDSTASLPLLCMGLAGLAFAQKRRKQKY